MLSSVYCIDILFLTTKNNQNTETWDPKVAILSNFYPFWAFLPFFAGVFAVAVGGGVEGVGGVKNLPVTEHNQTSQLISQSRM